jgi:hypothetical protein
MDDSKFPFAMHYSNLMASITKPRALVATNLYSSNERTQTNRPLGGHSIHSKLFVQPAIQFSHRLIYFRLTTSYTIRPRGQKPHVTQLPYY